MTPIPAHWTEVVLVCRKCSKKLDGGFGPKGKQKLVKALKAGLKETGRRRAVRVVEVGCLGLCPKRAVTMVTTARPGQVWAVLEGATVPEIIAAAIDSDNAHA